MIRQLAFRLARLEHRTCPHGPGLAALLAEAQGSLPVDIDHDEADEPTERPRGLAGLLWDIRHERPC